MSEIVADIAEALVDGIFHGIGAGIKSAKHRTQITKAAKIITSGGVVAFPTETVYGLGADAYNALAVERIYAAKGRPADNPLILHVANIKQFVEIADNPPEYAMKLAQAFWPGPLTLVVRKQYHLPSWVGGHPNNSTATVGVRIPKHPVALALLEAAGCPVAAPSANIAGRPSPTSARHVSDDNLDIDMILDGKIPDIGLESTVVDVTGDSPVILRPGAVTEQMICDTVQMSGHFGDADASPLTSYSTIPRSPGTKYRHYAPQAPMAILTGSEDNIAEYILSECATHHDKIVGAYVSKVTYGIIKKKLPSNLFTLIQPNELEKIAQSFFSQLREFDKASVDLIYSESVCDTGIGVAIMDRMQKAAEGRTVCLQ